MLWKLEKAMEKSLKRHEAFIGILFIEIMENRRKGR